MNNATFFINQLDATREMIEHYLEIMKPERLTISPPHFNHPHAQDTAFLRESFGEWPAIRILVHLLVYEELAVVPEMEKFILNIDGTVNWNIVDKTEQDYMAELPDTTDLIKRFRNVRGKQIDLLKKCSDDTLNKTEKQTPWGKVLLNFVVNKTIQQTITHGSKLYQKAIYWDMVWDHLENQ